RPPEAIVEGEVVAYDADADELRPFGEVMLRRRKHGIDEAVRDVPVGLFCFELLYADGQDLTQLPYPQRRARCCGMPTTRTPTCSAPCPNAAPGAPTQTWPRCASGWRRWPARSGPPGL